MNGADFDGVAISADGTNWYEVQGLRNANAISAAYQQFTVNLSAEAQSRGLTLNSQFKIRFNHYDDFTYGSDGFAFDDVAVTANALTPDVTLRTVFEDGFETGVLGDAWRLTGTQSQRTRISSAEGPRQGYHMLMDVHAATLLSRNEATLTVDLSDLEDVSLRFWMKEFLDEDHGPPAIPFTGGADFDGVAISEDGASWYHVQGLTSVQGVSANYTEYVVDLSAAAATHGLTLGPDFKIRFNHYDDTPITSDGFAFDDVRITARISHQLALTLPASIGEGKSVHGTVSVLSAVGEDTVVTLASNRPDGVTVPGSVTIPAGQTSSPPFSISAVSDTLLTGDFAAQILAQSTDYIEATAELLVTDDEVAPGLALSLPASLQESLSTSGTVSITSSPLFDLSVALSASPSLGLTLPSVITLPAGQFSASFTLAKPNNDIIDDLTTTQITAGISVSKVSRAVALTDNDLGAALVLNLPPAVYESDPPTLASVGLPSPLTVSTDTVVTLTSSKKASLTLPKTVVIPAGMSAVDFMVTPVNNTKKDGLRSVTVTATAGAATAGSGSVDVLDDEVHRLVIEAIPSPQVANVAFPVTIKAVAIDNELVADFGGQATVTASDGGLAAFTTGSFVSGIWTGNITIPNISTGVILTATSTAPALTGSSNPFDVGLGARLTVTPSSINRTLPAGEPGPDITVSLSNPGDLTVSWTAELLNAPNAGVLPLEDLLQSFNASYTSVTGLVPSRFDFTEGVTGTSISDGGSDMYDGGNSLSTNITTAGTYLTYSDGIITPSINLGSSGRYFTRKVPGMFLLAAEASGITQFQISGDLGADGFGSQGNGYPLQDQAWGGLHGICKAGVWSGRSQCQSPDHRPIRSSHYTPDRYVHGR